MVRKEHPSVADIQTVGKKQVSELKVEIFGRVQGVGFRHFVRVQAATFGIVGRVMNRPDGSVFAVAQGKREQLEHFLRAVQRGPPLSKVEGVSYFWRAPTQMYDDFVIALDRGLIEDQTRNFVNLGKRMLNIKKKSPVHVAIIPDGNRRWAQGKGLGKLEGHTRSASYKRVIALFEEAKHLGIRYMTFYGFSTENWRRSAQEVNGLFDLISRSVKKFRRDAHKNKVRFRHLGRKDRLPRKLMQEIAALEEETKNFNEFSVQLCLDYGGRDEIIRAINKILKSGTQEIKEDDLVHFLDSAGIPDPEMIIRTSGEQRTSGFMTFQSVYSELYFADCHFPEFGPAELRKAVMDFGRRGRRFGGN